VSSLSHLILQPLLLEEKGRKNQIYRILAPLLQERGWGEVDEQESGWGEEF